jgi:hypothetical protein
MRTDQDSHHSMKIAHLDQSGRNPQSSHAWCGAWILVLDHQLTTALGRRSSREYLGAHLLDVLQRLSKSVLIAVVQLYVIRRCGIRSKPDGLTDHKGDRLGKQKDALEENRRRYVKGLLNSVHPDPAWIASTSSKAADYFL